MWNSSGNTWIMHSIRYSWAISSLQLTTCSNILGNTTELYKSTFMLSSWERRTRLVPTNRRSSLLSCSRFSLSLFCFVNCWKEKQTEQNILRCFLYLPCMSLVLHSNPEFIHLRKVEKNKLNWIVYVAFLPWINVIWN